MHVSGKFHLVGFTKSLFAQTSGRKQSGLLAQARCFLIKTLFETYGWFATATLHVASPQLERAGAQRAFSSPIKAIGGAVMVKNVFRFGAGSLVKREHYSSSGDAARPPPAFNAGPEGAWAGRCGRG
jgi:hypothetical protein